MATLLKFTRFGNPILRQKAQKLSKEDIQSEVLQQLIVDMRHTVEARKAGVGLAAPQVGVSKALALIAIKPTPNRPNLKRFEQVIINPSYEGIGKRRGLWEGCISTGSGDDTLFGKSLRYPTIKATWHDEKGKLHTKELSGFVAHVFQHETDHLNGIVFTDLVRDKKSFMMADEYRKRIKKL